MGCVVDYIVNLDTIAFGLVPLHPFSLLKLHPGDAELRYEIRELNPIRDIQRRPLFDRVAIKGNRVAGWTRAHALQNSLFSFLRDLRRLDFGGLLDKFGRNTHNFSLAGTLSQSLESFPQFFSVCG